MTIYDLGDKTKILLTVQNEFPKLLRLGPQPFLIDLIQQSLSALIPFLKLTVFMIIMIYDNEEYNSPFQLKSSLVACGINSNDTNNSININNTKICAYPGNTERNMTQTKDNVT
jgi:hypothetical protein